MGKRMSEFVQISSPIVGDWSRSCELVSMRYDGSIVVEMTDENGRPWRLTFRVTQACRITTEECTGPILARLPKGGGLFAAETSEWLDELGKGSVHFMEKSRHFVLFCYDEIIEVVAWDCKIEESEAV